MRIPRAHDTFTINAVAVPRLSTDLLRDSTAEQNIESLWSQAERVPVPRQFFPFFMFTDNDSLYFAIFFWS